MSKSQGPMSVLGRYPSKSRPGKSYDVLIGEDEVLYCGCPPWKFQKGVQPKDRKPCGHIKKWKSGDRGLLD